MNVCDSVVEPAMEQSRCTRRTRGHTPALTSLTCPVPRRRTLTPIPPRTSCRAAECRHRRSSKAAARSCPSRPPLCPCSVRTPDIASWCWTEAWKPLPRKSAPCCAVRTFGTAAVEKERSGRVRKHRANVIRNEQGGFLTMMRFGCSLNSVVFHVGLRLSVNSNL